MKKSHSIRFEKLADYLDGRLGEAEAAEIALQLESADAETLADLAWLQSFKQIEHQVVLETPPASSAKKWRSVLAKRFEGYAQSRRPPSLLQRITAALTFDSFTQPALAGARSASVQGQRRQLVYSAGNADIALNIQPQAADPSFTVIGQLFTEEAETAVVEPYRIQLLQDNLEVDSTIADELGEFSFEAVEEGIFAIILSGGSSETVITPIELYL